MILLILLSVSYGQKLEIIDLQLDKLETVVQNASRSAQRVFVEDFTGLN